MIETSCNGLVYLQFENLSKYSEIVHYISTRKGGYSHGIYKGLNLGLRSGDDVETVLKNRKSLAEAINLPLERFIFARQVHSAEVVIVTESMAGLGALNGDTSIPDVDGMITCEKKLCVNAMGADCAPILLYDPGKKVVGAVHAGWKGTLKKIGYHAVKLITETYGCKASNIIAGVGPSNGPCCYQVGEEVLEQLEKEFDTLKPFAFVPEGKQKYHLDLWKTNEFALLQAGLNKKNIELAGMCTQCYKDLFYSARVTNGNTGRISGGIFLR